MDHGSTLKFCLAGQVLKEQVLETSRIHHYFMRTIVKELSLYLHEKKLSGGVDVELERVMRRSKNDENTHLTRLYESSRKQMVRMLQMESQKFCKFLAHALIRITMAKTGSGPDVRASILGAEKNLSPADVDLLSIQQDSSAAVAVLVDSDYGHNTATSPVDDSDFLHRKLSSEGRRRRRYKSGLGSDSNLQVSYTTNRHPPRSDAGSDQEHVSQEDIVMTTTSVPEGKMRATALRLVNALRSESDLLTGDNAVYRRRTAKVANWISSIGEGKKHRRVEDTAQLPATVRSMRLLKMASKFKDPADDVDSEDSRKVTYRHNKELERKQALEEAKETASKYHHASDRWRHRSKPRKTRPRRPPRGSQQQGFKAPDDVEPSTDDILNSFTPSGNKSSLDFLVVPAEKVLNPKTGRVRGRNKDADDDNDDDAGSTLGKHYLDDVPAGALKRVLHQVLPPGAASSKTSTSASSVSSSTSSNAWSKTVDKDHGRLATLKPIPMQRAPFCGKKCRVLFLKDVERYQDCLQRCLLGNTRYMKTMMLNILQEIQEANKVTVWNPSKQQPADALQGPTADMKPRPSTVSIKSLTKKSSRSSSRKRYRSPKRNRVRHVSGQDTTEKDGQEISAEEASQDHPQPEGTKCGDVEGIVKLQESAVKSITEEISKAITGKYMKAKLSKQIPLGVAKLLLAWKKDCWELLHRLQGLSVRNNQAILRAVYYRALEMSKKEPIERHRRKTVKELALTNFQLQKLTRLSSMPAELNVQYLKSMKTFADASRKILTLVFYEPDNVKLVDLLSVLADERANFFAMTDRFLLEKSALKRFSRIPDPQPLFVT